MDTNLSHSGDSFKDVRPIQTMDRGSHFATGGQHSVTPSSEWYISVNNEMALEDDAHHQQMQEEILKQIPEYLVLEKLQIYIPPLLLLIGTLGNVCVLVVLLQRHLRTQHSVCFYMAALIVINILVLHMGCGLLWLSRVAHIPHVANIMDWLCKVWQFMFTTLYYSSGWLVVLLAVDRFIYMWYPLRATYICTVFTAKLFIVSTFIGIGIICIHSMWTYELQPGLGCSIDPHQRDFETVVWPWVLATVCSYMPLVLTLTLMVTLIVGLCSCATCNASDIDRLQVQYTRLTVCACALYLLCSVPTIIINFVEYFQPMLFLTLESKVQLFLAKEVAHQTNCLFLASTFCVYFLYAPQLRLELSALRSRHCCYETQREEVSPVASRRVSLEELEARGKLLTNTSSVCALDISQSTSV